MEISLENFYINGSIEEAIKTLENCSDPVNGLLFSTFFSKIFDRDKKILLKHAFFLKENKRYYEAYKTLSFVLSFPFLKNREEIEKNLSECINNFSDTFSFYSHEKVSQILEKQPSIYPMITFTITTCKRYDLFEKTINSFLNCCLDILKIDKWVCIDDNSSDEDRQKMKDNYPFFEFYFKEKEEKGHPRSMNLILEKVKTPYVFHMEDDWKFFEKRFYLTECMDVLCSFPNIGQCLINRNYAETGNDIKNVGGYTGKTIYSTRYRIHEYCRNAGEQEAFNNKYNHKVNCAYWPHFSFRPSLIKTEVFRKIGSFNENAHHFEMEYAERYIREYVSAFLDGVYCLHIGRLTSERHDITKKNAYNLNDEKQFYKPVEEVEKEEIKDNNITTHDKGVYQIKTVIVNLERRRDRLENFIKNNIQCAFLNPVVFPAVDGVKIKTNEQLQRIFDGNDFNMKQGMVGCALSHIKLYIDFLKTENTDILCVLEDDITLVPDFQRKFIKVVKDLAKTTLLDESWDLCYLGHHVWNHQKTKEMYDENKDPGVELWNIEKSLKISMGGTIGYLICKKGAKKLLDFINKNGMTNCIDTMQQKSADTLQIYYCSPHLVYSKCWTPNDPVDTDIMSNNSSLTVLKNKRIIDMLTYFRNKGYVSHVDCETFEKYIENNTEKDVFYLTEKAEKILTYISKLQETDVFFYPIYDREDGILIVVPNPDEEDFNTIFFDRLKKNGEFNIDDVLKN